MEKFAQPTEVEILHGLFKEIGGLHGASVDFEQKFGNKTQGKPYRKGWFNKAVVALEKPGSKIRALLPEAIACAEEVLAKHRRLQKEQSLLSLNTGDIQDIIDFADLAFESGEVISPLGIMNKVYKKVNSEKLLSLSPETFVSMHITLGKCNMQQGVKAGTDSLGIIKPALQTVRVNQRKFPEKSLKTLNLYGHLLRQRDLLHETMNWYKTLENELGHFGLNLKEEQAFMMNILHQYAITLTKIGRKTHNQEAFLEAKKYFRKSNEWFKDYSNSEWSDFTHIREAGLLLELDDVDGASKFLDDFENSSHFARLTGSHQAIFIRLNALKYLKAGDREFAQQYIHAGLDFTERKDYRDEYEKIALLEQILKK